MWVGGWVGVCVVGVGVGVGVYDQVVGEADVQKASHVDQRANVSWE